MIFCIRKVSDGKVLAECAEVVDSLWRRLHRLALCSAIPENRGWLVTPCSRVCMVFRRSPIDVVFLDRNQVVIAFYQALRPWWGRTSRHPEAVMALELPPGTLTRAMIHTGDLVHLEKVV